MYFITKETVMFLLLLFGMAGCTALKVEEAPVSEKKVLDIPIPPEMPICLPNESATASKPCYEGKVVIINGGESIQETCGKYWDMYPDDEHKAVMERVDCCKRNNAVLIYYLKLNRDSVKYMQNLLLEGL